MSLRQRRTGATPDALGIAGGGSRVAIVLGCILVGTVLAGIAHAMRGSPHYHEPLDDLYDEYDRAIDHSVVNMRALSHQLGRVQPEALRNGGAL